MPRGDIERLKADPEDGTAPIARLLLDALPIAKLSGLELRAVLFLWRQTYGWKDRSNPTGGKLKRRRITLREWAEHLNSSQARVSEALNSLVGKKVIRRGARGAGRAYGDYEMNTEVGEWTCLDQELLRRLINVSQNVTVTKKETVSQNGGGTVSQNVTELFPDRESVPDTNLATTNKNTIKKEPNISSLFDLWNEHKIIVHKKLTDEIRRSLKASLDTYSFEEIAQGIQNYATILNDPAYVFTYRWTLTDFLRRGLEKFLDLEVARNNFRRHKDEPPQRKSRFGDGWD